jgi:hypothetical protein
MTTADVAEIVWLDLVVYVLFIVDVVDGELVLVVKATETEDGAAVEAAALAVGVSETREPVRVNIAAQSERDNPFCC